MSSKRKEYMVDARAKKAALFFLVCGQTLCHETLHPRCDESKSSIPAAMSTTPQRSSVAFLAGKKHHLFSGRNIARVKIVP